MNYPLISEYIEAIKSAEDNFEELSYLRPILGDDGLPVMTSGNFAVVFKMKNERNGKFYAVKCFTKELEGRAEAYREITKELKDVSSPHLTSVRYLEKELFVDTDQTDETEFPVLLMDWVEGKTLDKYLRENLDDKYALEMLAYRFSQLAQWLIPQPFAHGDLKPDNILVREDGTLVLVDYDGMYVPTMKGQKARELGSPDFRHPLRTENDFDEHIDDFPLVSILLSLKAISLEPNLFEEYGAVGRLLLSERDYLSRYDSLVLKAIQRLDYNKEIDNIYSFLFYDYDEDYRDIKDCFVLNKPTPSNSDWSYLQTACGRTHLSEGIKDEYGSIYSKGGERLLRVRRWGNFGSYYCVKPETRIICDCAFTDCSDLKYIDIPQSVEKIGQYAFADCRNLQFLKIPEGVDVLRTGMFMNCSSLLSIFITNSVKTIHESVFLKCVSLQSIDIPLGLTSIGEGAFSGCESLKGIDIPNSVTTIGQFAFVGCRGLKRVSLSNGMSKIELGCFSGCHELEEVIVPKGVRCIDHSAFGYCKKLKKVYLPDSVIEIGEESFVGCESLISIVVPKGTKWRYGYLLPDFYDKIVESAPNEIEPSTKISSTDWDNRWEDEYGAFYSSDRKRVLGFGSYDYEAKVYQIKGGTLVICDLAFNNYENDNHFLEDIFIPSSVESIGENPFAGCIGLNIHCDSIFFNVQDSILYSQDYSCLISSTNSTNNSIELHPKVRTIGAYALSFCRSKRIKMPPLIKCIKESAFSFSEIELLIISGVLFIDKGAFSNCEYLTDVYLDGYENTHIDPSAFDGCVNLQHVFVSSGCADSYKKKVPSIANKIYGVGTDEYYAGLTEIENAKEIFELGKTYWAGKGIKKDLNEAVRLYELASELGDEDAKKELDYWGQYWFDEDKAIYSKNRETFHGVLSGYEYEIKEGTKFIADGACSDMGWEIDCSYFSKLTIPDSIIGIGDNPFGCQMRKVICFSPFFAVENDTLYSKGKKELIQCYNHETDEYVIPEGVEIIRSYAFYACNFRKVTIPSSVLTIGENPFVETGVFEDHHTVLEVLSNSALYSVINDALYERNRLIAYWGESELFELPDGIEEIGNKAFWGARVRRIILSTSLKTVAEDAFYWTERLKEIVVPANEIERFKQILPQYIHRDIVEVLNIDEMPF